MTRRRDRSKPATAGTSGTARTYPILHRLDTSDATCERQETTPIRCTSAHPQPVSDRTAPHGFSRETEGRYEAASPTRGTAVRRIAAPLVALYGEREARQIALTVVSELADLPPAALLADPSAPVEVEGLDRIAEELSSGRPMQYVLGHAEFCGLRIGVREGVLIPRPETEELAQWIASANRKAHRILDIGTGSGCIALALKYLLPEAEVCGVDLSEEALAVARENADLLGLRVAFRRADALQESGEGRTTAAFASVNGKIAGGGPQLHGTTDSCSEATRDAHTGAEKFDANPVAENRIDDSSIAERSGTHTVAENRGDGYADRNRPVREKVLSLVECFGGRFDLIVSNPPYIPQKERDAMRSNVTDYEPDSALFVPDEDPLRFYRAIARAGHELLARGGRLYFEVHECYAAAVRNLLAEMGYAETELRTDFHDKPRMLCGRKMH